MVTTAKKFKNKLKSKIVCNKKDLKPDSKEQSLGRGAQLMDQQVKMRPSIVHKGEVVRIGCDSQRDENLTANSKQTAKGIKWHQNQGQNKHQVNAGTIPAAVSQPIGSQNQTHRGVEDIK